MKDYLEISRTNTAKAWEIVRKAGIMEAWRSVGAEINTVGSLRLGLMMKHLDIDFHIYTGDITVAGSFEAVRRIAECPQIKRIEYRNLLDTDESCIEWHAWYEECGMAGSGGLWQIDMIHIRKGSVFDGYFEKVADRISAVMTDEMRIAILRLKYQTPDSGKIPGIEYYRAVIEGGVRTWREFMDWRTLHPVDGIVEWMP